MDNPQCSGVTGRQRVMSAEMQGNSTESVFSFARWLRVSQGCDYEMSTSVYMGAFALLGVMPGVVIRPLCLSDS